jgi:hypothetical protein
MAEAGNLDGRRHDVSWSQERIWLAEQTLSKSPFNLAYRFDIAGSLDVERLAAAVEAVGRAHPFLRARFDEHDGRVGYTLTDAAPTLAVQAVELERLDEAVTQLAEQPFDPASAPLCRFALLTHGEDRATLVVVLHHLIVDGRGIAVLLRQLGAHYADPGRAPEICDPAAAIAQERSQEKSARFKRGERYWQGELAGLEAENRLRFVPGEAETTRGDNTHVLDLSPELVTSLDAAARRMSVTLFGVLASAAAIVVGRCTRRRKVALATLAENRTAIGADAVACFANLLPLVVEVEPDRSVVDLGRRTHATLGHALDAAVVPFQRMVALANPTRTVGTTPFAQVLVLLQDSHAEQLSLDGCTVTRASALRPVTEFDASFILERRGEGFSLIGEFRRDAVGAGHGERLMRQLVHVLSALAAADEETLVGSVSLMDESERSARLALMRGPQASTDPGDVVRRFAAVAAERPDDVAVLTPAGTSTFRQVWDVAGDIARELAEAGVRRGDVVAVALGHSRLLPSAIFGVWRQEAIYLPLDPTTPEARIRSVLADSRCRVAIGLPPGATPWPVREVAPQPPPRRHPAGAEGDLVSPCLSDSPAYLMYTSGSTGAPKGVLISHAALATFCDAFGTIVADDAARRPWLAATTPTFDISMVELVWTLATGRPIVCGDDLAGIEALAS